MQFFQSMQKHTMKVRICGMQFSLRSKTQSSHYPTDSCLSTMGSWHDETQRLRSVFLAVTQKENKNANTHCSDCAFTLLAHGWPCLLMQIDLTLQFDLKPILIIIIHWCRHEIKMCKTQIQSPFLIRMYFPIKRQQFKGLVHVGRIFMNSQQRLFCI